MGDFHGWGIAGVILFSIHDPGNATEIYGEVLGKKENSPYGEWQLLCISATDRLGKVPI